MFRPSAQFEKSLDKATSNLLLEPDWPAILQVCDHIRQNDVQAKQALTAIKKKLNSPNPHIALYALLVLECCVKNCGQLVHDEIGTRTYMEGLRELVKTTPHDSVKKKILEMIQAWAHAFRNNPKYRAVLDTVHIMKTEGHQFPVLKESDAMFSADTAPQWTDGEVCNRCRVQFSMIQRKHHCRACGKVFCAQCSSKNSTIPKFGIEKEVRVCDACYQEMNDKTPPLLSKSVDNDLPAEYLASSLSQQNQEPPRKSEDELREEEELQLALALSQSEAEQKDKEKRRMLQQTGSRTRQSYSPVRSTSAIKQDLEDPELARYLNRQYWEDKQKEDKEREKMASPMNQIPSAPINVSSPLAISIDKIHKQENGETDSQMEEFVDALRSQVEIFVNRMKSNSSRGRSIANDSSVQTLFMNITAMHSTLLRYIQQQDDSRVYYEGLQDKLAQVRDSRAALDALREEHREKERRKAEAAERSRQLQMAQKLEIMRKKKQDYLQYQRQLALQKIQEEEREMQMRQEQQKQQYRLGSLPYGMTYSNAAGGYIATHADGSPVHGPQYAMPGQFQSLPPIPGNPDPAFRPYPMYSGTGLPNQMPPHMQGVPPSVQPSNLGPQGQLMQNSVQGQQTLPRPMQVPLPRPASSIQVPPGMQISAQDLTRPSTTGPLNHSISVSAVASSQSLNMQSQGPQSMPPMQAQGHQNIPMTVPGPQSIPMQPQGLTMPTQGPQSLPMQAPPSIPIQGPQSMAMQSQGPQNLAGANQGPSNIPMQVTGQNMPMQGSGPQTLPNQGAGPPNQNPSQNFTSPSNEGSPQHQQTAELISFD